MKQILFHKSQILIVGVLLCLLFGLTGCKDKPDNANSGISYAIEQPYYKGPLRVQIKLEKDTIPLSGLLPLEIVTEIDPGYELEYPAVNDIFEQFKVQNIKEQPSRLADNNKTLKISHYELEPLETGQCEIPSLTFTFAPKDSEKQGLNRSTLTTEPVWIEVTTSLPVDIQEVTIEDIEDVVEMRASYHWAWFVVGGIVSGVIIAVTISLRCKKKTQVETKRIYKAAHEIAFEMLKAIADEKMVEQGQIKLFYEKLSSCLRQYIENRFELRAPEQTTEEFLENLKTSNALKLEHKQELQKFLEHCDLVKFAGYQPTNDQINESLTMAEQFVERTKSDEHLVDVTNRSQAERQVV